MEINHELLNYKHDKQNKERNYIIYNKYFYIIF